MGRGTSNAGRGRGFVAVTNQYGSSFDKRYIDRSNAKPAMKEKKQFEGISSVPKTATQDNRSATTEQSSNKRTMQQQGVSRGCGQGVVRVDQSSGLDSGQGVVAGVGRSHGRCVDRNSGEQGRGQGVNQGSVLGSSDSIGLQSDALRHTLMSSHIEDGDGDGDDVSSVHVTSTKRGSASQFQVPKPKHREWIYIQDGEFSNQIRSTRVIGVNLKSMWNGPWENWKDIPNEDKKRLFERFQCYFQWEEKWNGEIYMCWERRIVGKIPNMLSRVRDATKAIAIRKGVQVEDDMSGLVDFKPPWVKMETWKQMIDIWNTPEWKAKSQRNKNIRSESKGGKHTLGSQTYVTAKKKWLRQLVVNHHTLRCEHISEKEIGRLIKISIVEVR
ncbi:putative transposase, Ptta/En/Spm, plant [Helianthus debilis subsp. tardiflorus]